MRFIQETDMDIGNMPAADINDMTFYDCDKCCDTLELKFSLDFKDKLTHLPIGFVRI